MDDAIEDGQAIKQDTTRALDAAVDYALEQRDRASVELQMQRQDSEARRKETQAKLDTIDKVESSLERRKALIALSKELS